MLAKGDDLAVLLLFALLAFLLALFWLDNLINCARRLGRGESSQLVWLVLIVLMPVIGALGYFIFARRFSRRRI